MKYFKQYLRKSYDSIYYNGRLWKMFGWCVSKNTLKTLYLPVFLVQVFLHHLY